ncbi:hypothetical protein ACTXKF_19130 [Vreelandella alkaliphila]|uniref:hypothetical protein n=1 Tax=Vreelandella alkaliphila TaxID=272774 RepID=UPI003FD6D654
MYYQRDFQVILKGNSKYLRVISESPPSTDYFRVYGGVDHWNDCPSEDFSFDSIYFEKENDPELIWQISHELLSLLNGALKLFNYNFREFSIYRIYHFDKQLIFMESTSLIGLLGKPDIAGFDVKEEKKKAFQTSQVIGILALATDNEDVYMLLKYLSFEGGWSNYYKLMETVESCSAKHDIKMKIDKEERRRFANTANNFSLSGFSSRHGFKQIVKENKTPMMSVEEAHCYVTELCKQYISLKYKEYF